jgi:hypothetical protein
MNQTDHPTSAGPHHALNKNSVPGDKSAITPGGIASAPAVGDWIRRGKDFERVADLYRPVSHDREGPNNDPSAQ